MSEGGSTAEKLRALLAFIGRRDSSLLLSRDLFLRALGVIYLIAFASLWAQVDALIGSHGILPAADYLAAVKQQTGADRYWLLPTLCWFGAGDGFLNFLCWGGALISLLVIAGVCTRLALALAWVFYLSLSCVGQIFLGYQWDALLLEVGLLAIFYAPGNWLPRHVANETPPRVLVVWLLRWLLFRLMFASGAVKLISEDKMWWNFTALTVHYETQPLPTWLGWHAHQLPEWAQVASCAVMFAIELGGPFLIFGGRRARLGAGSAFALLMLLIAATGNYTFFNLLTLALCLPLVEDGALRKIGGALRKLRWRKGAKENGGGEERTAPAVSPFSPGPPPTFNRWWEAVKLSGLGLSAAFMFMASGGIFFSQIFHAAPPWPIGRFSALASPLRSINGYGLFAVMTPTRPEIIVEGSNDGVTWQAYEFKWKAGDLKRAPSFVAPHQPRLDWQMWFGALGEMRGNPWFVNFVVRLLQGSPKTLALLESNPFPNAPPRFIRARLYEYHFTDYATRRTTGEWWRRELKAVYCPPVSLTK